MNVSTLLRIVVPAAESAENESAAKPAVGGPAPAPAPAHARGTPAARPVPAPQKPGTDGAYQFGAHRQPIAQKAPALLEAGREFPSLKALEARYPHVLAKIRAAWGNPRAFDLLMRELLIPSRQDRKGFDPEAAVELTRLREYYALVVTREHRSLAPGRPG